MVCGRGWREAGAAKLKSKKNADAKRKPTEPPPVGYLVQVHQPETGETAEESVADMKGAIARAVELIRAGYIVEITSATSPAYGGATRPSRTAIAKDQRRLR